MGGKSRNTEEGKQYLARITTKWHLHNFIKCDGVVDINMQKLHLLDKHITISRYCLNRGQLQGLHQARTNFADFLENEQLVDLRLCSQLALVIDAGLEWLHPFLVNETKQKGGGRGGGARLTSTAPDSDRRKFDSPMRSCFPNSAGVIFCLSTYKIRASSR